MVQKNFLDAMYDLRGRVILDITRLDEKKNQPTAEGTSEHDVTMAELRTRRSQLSSIDTTIEEYLILHAGAKS